MCQRARHAERRQQVERRRAGVPDAQVCERRRSSVAGDGVDGGRLGGGDACLDALDAGKREQHHECLVADAAPHLVVRAVEFEE